MAVCSLLSLQVGLPPVTPAASPAPILSLDPAGAPFAQAFNAASIQQQEGADPSPWFQPSDTPAAPPPPPPGPENDVRPAQDHTGDEEDNPEPGPASRDAAREPDAHKDEAAPVPVQGRQDPQPPARWRLGRSPAEHAAGTGATPALIIAAMLASQGASRCASLPESPSGETEGEGSGTQAPPQANGSAEPKGPAPIRGTEAFSARLTPVQAIDGKASHSGGNAPFLKQPFTGPQREDADARGAADAPQADSAWQRAAADAAPQKLPPAAATPTQAQPAAHNSGALGLPVSASDSFAGASRQANAVTPAGNTAAAELEPSQPRGAAQPVRDLSLHMDGDQQRVMVRISERGGDLHVQVRSSDANLADGLRGRVSELVGGLATRGYATEVRHTGESAGSNAGDDQGRHGQPDVAQQGQQHQQRRQQAEETWAQHIDDAVGQPAQSRRERP